MRLVKFTYGEDNQSTVCYFDQIYVEGTTVVGSTFKLNEKHKKMINAVLFGLFNNQYHLRKSLSCHIHHKMNVLILLFCEVLIRLTLAVNCSGQVVTAVANAFNFSNFT